MRSNADGPTSRCGSALRSGISGGFVATGARAVAGSIRRLPPAGRETRSFASRRSGAHVGLPCGRETSSASAAAEEMLALATEEDARRAGAMHMAGMAAHERDDLDQVVELYEGSARLAREHGDTGIVTIAVNNLGTIAAHRGDHERALELFEEALGINREGHDRHLVALALLNIGITKWMLGDLERARELLRDGLAAARDIGQVDLFIEGFAILGVAYARQDPPRAARLLGRAD